MLGTNVVDEYVRSCRGERHGTSILPCQSSALTVEWQVFCYELAGWLHELTDIINNLISPFILYKLHCTKIVLMSCECYLQIICMLKL
jgi:hypothetical protein